MPLCPHQARDVGKILCEVQRLGEAVSLTSEEASSLAITSIMPHDMAEADIMLWKVSYIRFLLREGVIDRRCPACGNETEPDAPVLHVNA
jgi:hypothetical protein